MNRLTRMRTMLPVESMAARACLPTNCPSTMASVVEYSCWNSEPKSMGKKNSSSCFQITPWVMPLAAVLLRLLGIRIP